MEKPTKEELEVMTAQLDAAKDQLAERWVELSTQMEHMAKFLNGESSGETDDVEMVQRCVQTCLGQCMVYWNEVQMEKLRNEASTT